MPRIRWLFLPTLTILASTPLAAQTSRLNFLELRDWLELNVVALSAAPADLLSLAVEGCDSLKTNWVAGKQRERTVRVAAPVRWRKISLSPAFSLPTTHSGSNGATAPVIKTTEVTPAREPGTTIVRIDYKSKEVTREDSHHGARPAGSAIAFTMRTREDAEEVLAKFTRLAELCSAGQ